MLPEKQNSDVNSPQPPQPLQSAEDVSTANPPTQPTVVTTVDDQNRQNNSLGIVSLVLAFLVPLAGMTIAIIGYQRAEKLGSKNKGLFIASFIVNGFFIIVSLAILGFIIATFYALGAFHGNDAQVALQPLQQSIKSVDAKELCNNGDSGYSLDNTTPWYRVYYSALDTDNLEQTIRKTASDNGFRLSENTALIRSLKGLPAEEGGLSSLYPDDTYSPQSSYLVGKNGGETLEVTIHRNTSVSLLCGIEDYGKKQPTDNKAIVEMLMTLPDTN